MEPLTIFASSVGCISVLHLLSTAVDRLGKGIYTSGNQQAKRIDWYCFFQPSDLLGEDRQTNGTINTQQRPVTKTERLEQKRRQQANRPRLQV